MRRHVVVTGMGAITPSGLDVATLWDAVAHGRSAITTLDDPAPGELRLGESSFDALPVRIGGRVRGFDPSVLHDRQLARRLDAVQQWAVAAADQALRQAGVPMPMLRADATAPGSTVPTPAPDSTVPTAPGSTVPAAPDSTAPPDTMPWDAERVAIIAATGSGPVDAMQQATRLLDERGPRAVPLTLAMLGAPDAAAAVLSRRYGTFGPTHGVSATCASGAMGLGEGLRAIRHGYADAVLVVGMEDCLNAVNVASNANLRALATGYEDDPTAACRPFDRGRRGFVMAQGAAAVLLEAEDVARARGAAPLAVLTGFGASSDAHHPTAPEPNGRGGARAVRQALDDAELTPDDIAHVNAHGTGTPAGDAAELRALHGALGDRARGIPISATKSTTGHLLGASGVVEAVIAVMTVRDGLLPPTVNVDDPEFPDWDVVTAPRMLRPRHVLSTSFGFGGHNGAVILSALDEEMP